MNVQAIVYYSLLKCHWAMLRMSYPYIKMHRGDSLDGLPEHFRQLALQVAPPHRNQYRGDAETNDVDGFVVRVMEKWITLW